MLNKSSVSFLLLVIVSLSQQRSTLKASKSFQVLNIHYHVGRAFKMIFFCLIVKSFIELTKTLLEEGVPFVLSEKFSQDPLEEHFARHRRSVGCNENELYSEFQRGEVSLSLVQSNLISDLRGNTQGRPDKRDPIDIDDQRLPRKKVRKDLNID